MIKPTPKEPTIDVSHSHDVNFSLVQGGPPYRIQRKLGLIPRRGLGIPRRVIFFVCLTWVPIMVWAIVNERVYAGVVAEPLLQHFGVHVRCLLVLPLLIAAEAVAEGISRRSVPYFVTSGLISEATKPRFVEVLQQAVRLRDSWVAAAAMAVLAVLLAWRFTGTGGALYEDALSWAVSRETGQIRLGFGDWWFLFVVRPVFTFFLLYWVWRLIVATVLFWRIAHLDLRLVPTHPDRAAGLGFLGRVPFAFSPVVLAMSAVIASHWAHQILYHGAHVTDFKFPLALFVAVILVMFLGPFLLFAPLLGQLKRRSLLEYGALVGEHGRLVRRRWIGGEALESEALLEAPELGPVADTVSMYEAVERIRPVPLGTQSVVAIVAPALLPMIPVTAIEVPLKDTLLKLLGVLI
jgi:hypothetical protein